MSGPLVLVGKYHRIGAGYSRAAQAMSREHPGRRRDGSQSAASWVSDLADLRKMVILCGWCRPHFNPRRHGYRRFTMSDAPETTPHGLTKCDACSAKLGDTPGGGVAFIPEEAFTTQCLDPATARWRSRIRSQQAWTGAQARASINDLLLHARPALRERMFAGLRVLLNRRWGSRRPREAAAPGGKR